MDNGYDTSVFHVDHGEIIGYLSLLQNDASVSFWWFHILRPGSAYIPYWPIVVAIGSLAAGPWLRWRFTLRTLLITTTLVAVVLGMIVWAARRL